MKINLAASAIKVCVIFKRGKAISKSNAQAMMRDVIDVASSAQALKLINQKSRKNSVLRSDAALICSSCRHYDVLILLSLNSYRQGNHNEAHAQEDRS